MNFIYIDKDMGRLTKTVIIVLLIALCLTEVYCKTQTKPASKKESVSKGKPAAGKPKKIVEPEPV